MVGFRKEALVASAIVRAKNSKSRKQSKLDEYAKSPVKCGFCEKTLSYQQAKGGQKFCCRSCSNSAIPRLNSDESKRKVSVALAGVVRSTFEPIEKACEQCQTPFIVSTYRRRNVKTCSSKCNNLLRAKHSAETKTRNGTHSGWHNRRGEVSYPEKYFRAVFEAEGLYDFETEKKVGKWFIDFAFADKMIAVEVDGRQHDDEERRLSDIEKDKFLTNAGWTVLRVKWFNPISEVNRQKLYPQIDLVKSLLRNEHHAKKH